MSDTTFSGSSAVVTGAASGIGRALAEQLVGRGASVYAADVATPTFPPSPSVDWIHTDVADPGDVERLAERAPDALIVCLNAGITSTATGAVWESPPAEWDRVLRVNLGGVVNGLRAFVPRLLARAEPAHILITASLAGLATWPGGGPYAASKHAVVAVAEQTALSLAGSNVAVTLLCPALVRSGMSDQGEDPHVVATTALDAMANGAFVVAPQEWTQAIRDRGDRLATGLQPRLPEPTTERTER